jgi:hypothetical protein
MGITVQQRDPYRQIIYKSYESGVYQARATVRLLRVLSSRGNHDSTCRISGSFGDLPVVVLSAEWWVMGKQAPMNRAMPALRDEQAKLSTRGEYPIITRGEDGDLPILQPDAIAGVVGKICQR